MSKPRIYLLTKRNSLYHIERLLYCQPVYPIELLSNAYLIEFSLNIFTEISDKNICHYIKKALTCHLATSCVRDQDATTVPARHM